MADDDRRVSLARASAFLDAGADLARRASDAFDAGDDLQRELFAWEVERLVLGFDVLPTEDRDFILWVAFMRVSTPRL